MNDSSRPSNLATVRRRSFVTDPRFLIILCCTLLACCKKRDGDASTSDTSHSDSNAATAQPTPDSAASTAAVAATVETVKTESYNESVDASGIVGVQASGMATLSAPAPTRVTAIHVAIGNSVRANQRLVSFEQTSFDAAVASADAALNVADLSAQRAKRLVEAGASPRKDLELATSELAAARAASVTAHRAQQLAVLQSPIDGVVTKMDARLGANVDAGQALVEISDVNALEVQLVIPPAAANNVRSGQAVVLRGGAAADAPPLANGRVLDVSAVLDSNSRGVLIRVGINPSKRTFRIGETVFGHIQTVAHAAAVIIPDAALVPNGDSFQVFTVDAENRAHATTVEIGGRSGHRVWISSGLKSGDRIVTTGAYGVSDGAAVVANK